MPDAELIFRALADGTRRRLLRVLSAHELSVSELVQVLGQPQSTVSRHLKVLRDAGLLVDHRAGATVMYAAPPPRVFLHAEPGAANGQPAAGNGVMATSVLRDRLLDWLGREGVETDLQRRVDAVTQRRRAEGSGFFDSVGARWDQLRAEAFGDAFHFEALSGLLPAEWTVADIGTGTGHLLPMLAAQFRNVIAVDPAANMLEVARERPELARARNIVFREGSLDDLPIESDALDLAIASLVLHHVDEPVRAVAEIGRCVRSGGRVLLIEQAAHEHADFHERMGDRWPGFEAKDVKRWVRRAGFAQMSVKTLATARATGRLAGHTPSLFAVTASKE
jgi:ArsR family transcriptional regulator